MSTLEQKAVEVAMEYLKAHPKVVVYDMALAMFRAGAEWANQPRDSEEEVCGT